MANVTKADLLFYIDEMELNQIIDNDDGLLVRPIEDAEARVKAKIEQRYNADAILADLPSYPSIRKIIVCIAIFNVYDRVQVRHMPENKKESFALAEQDLYLISNGEWNPNLPLIPLEGDQEVSSGESYGHFDEFNETNVY